MMFQKVTVPRRGVARVSRPEHEAAMMPLAVAVAGPGSTSGRVVALIASQRREGTTSMVMALADALEHGLSRSVAVIDANMTAPRLHEIHALPATPGLADVLRGDVPLHSALNVAESGSLAVLTAGRAAPGDLAPLIAAGRLGALVDRIRAEGFAYCLLDCPALLPSPDAALVAAEADATYLVVTAERTKWDTLRQASQHLANGGARLSGTVLNRYRSHLPKFLDRRV
jgi:Mrp family chromosome partitioning ATPase